MRKNRTNEIKTVDGSVRKENHLDGYNMASDIFPSDNSEK